MSQRNAWNQASDAYNSLHENDLSLIRTATEAVLAQLGDVRGQSALEIGCGAGRLCIALAGRGASVTGIDISDAQLARAAERVAEAGVAVRLLRTDAGDLSALADGAFDAVVAVFVTPYIEDIDGWLGECHRLLRPGGRLLFAQDHPIRACFWDEEMQEESVLPARSYFDNTPLRWTFTGTETGMTTHHRTLAGWFSSLHEAGFVVSLLKELPLPDGWVDDPNADEYTRDIAAYLPQILIIEAKKLMK